MAARRLREDGVRYTRAAGLKCKIAPRLLLAEAAPRAIDIAFISEYAVAAVSVNFECSFCSPFLRLSRAGTELLDRGSPPRVSPRHPPR